MVLPVTTLWVYGIHVYRDVCRACTVCVYIYTIYVCTIYTQYSKWLSCAEFQIKVLHMSLDGNLSPGIATDFLIIPLER